MRNNGLYETFRLSKFDKWMVDIDNLRREYDYKHKTILINDLNKGLILDVEFRLGRVILRVNGNPLLETRVNKARRLTGIVKSGLSLGLMKGVTNLCTKDQNIDKAYLNRIYNILYLDTQHVKDIIRAQSDAKWDKGNY